MKKKILIERFIDYYAAIPKETVKTIRKEVTMPFTLQA